MDTLAILTRSSRGLLGRPLAVPIDEEWFLLVHGHETAPAEVLSAAPRDRTAESSRRIVTKFAQLSQRLAQPPHAPAGDRCTSIIAHVADAVLNGSEHSFMGPMCSPFRRTHVAELIRQPYFVTEKSDGMRVLFVSLLAPALPRWAVAGCPENTLNLTDIALLEQAYDGLGEGESSESGPLPLSIGRHLLRRIRRSTSTVSSDASPDETEDVLFLVVVVVGKNPVDAPAQEGGSSDGELVVRVERRWTPRHLSYCLDRSLDTAYLLLDEYPFPGLASVVLDGELVLTHPSAASASVSPRPRYILGCFDIFCYTPLPSASGTAAATAVGSAPPSATVGKLGLVCLQRSRMSERLEIMRTVVLDALNASCDQLVNPRYALSLFCKEMWPLRDLHLCLARISPVDVPTKAGRPPPLPGNATATVKTAFLFDGPHGLTMNDGLIFTPDDFPIVSGASRTQFKWKWPSMLSIDWRLRADTGNPGYYHVEMYFRKKRHNHSADTEGHSKLPRTMQMLNPHGIHVPSDGPGLVVECVFDYSSGLWSMEKVRTDKLCANSAVAVVSVLESAVERMTLRNLLTLAGCASGESETAEAIQRLLRADDAHFAPHPAPPLRPAESREPAVVASGNSASMQKAQSAARNQVTCQFTLRATQRFASAERELNLLWCIYLPGEKNPIPCPHVNVRECFGLGESCPAEDSASRLEEHLLIELANHGGSYAWSDFIVDAVFSSEHGRWCIVGFNPSGNNGRSTCASVVLHLDAQLRGLSAEHALSSIGGQVRDAVAVATTRRFFRTPPRSLTDAHYAVKSKELSSERLKRSSLRHFNNWIKSALIAKAAAHVRSATVSGGAPRDLTVCDLCCGRGGDLAKWRSIHPALLLMADSCFEAVAEGASRYCVGSGLSTKIAATARGAPGIPAHFAVVDCFTSRFVDGADPAAAGGAGPQEGSSGDILGEIRQLARRKRLGAGATAFTIVSCQFSMHYAFSHERVVRSFLSIVSQALEKGGVFIGTTVSDKVLLGRRQAHGDTFGNAVYRVNFLEDGDRREGGSPFGLAYQISVEESVTELREYVVPWDHFLQVAASPAYGLNLLHEADFLDADKSFVESEGGKEHLKSMLASRKRPPGGDGLEKIQLTADEEEAVSLFRLFMFEKV